MKKIVKQTIALSLLAVVASIGSWKDAAPVGAADSCESYVERHAKVEFWSSFGSSYTTKLQDIIDEINDDQTLNIEVEHLNKGSYDRIKSDMMSYIMTGDYPDVCVGYPDHFAEYIGAGIMVPLDGYISRYNAAHGTDLLKDEYYEDYMRENKSLDVDCNGNPVISAIPFNKSTELLGYNGVFVDYCVDWCSKNPTVQVGGVAASEWHPEIIPETWQEWAVKGNYYKYIMDTLTMKKSPNGTVERVGKVVYGNQNYEGTASDFEVVETPESTLIEETATHNNKSLLLDFHKVEESASRVISWDATDNMFITLLRQWGSEYTLLPEDEKLEEPFYRKGHIRFNAPENRAKTIECLKFFTNLNLKGIFGVPESFGEGVAYSSDAFAENQVMFMLCSSGGLGYNCTKWRNRFRVAHLPYYKAEEDGQMVVRKYVISQGANLGMTINNTDGPNDDAFELMVALTTGKYQLQWCLKTGYFPASMKVAASQEYQDFLYEDQKVGDGYPEKAYQAEDPDSGEIKPALTRAAFREGSRVNQDYYVAPLDGKTNHYMDDGVKWEKFVDDAFVHSSDIRTAIKLVFPNCFALTTSAAQNDSSYQNLLDEVCQKFLRDSNVVVDGMQSKKGCFGSLTATCGIVSFLSLVGVGLMMAKKNKGENYEKAN